MKKIVKRIFIAILTIILFVCSLFTIKKTYIYKITKDIKITDNTEISLEHLSKEIEKDDNIGTLTIPKILLVNAPIREGTDLAILSNAIGHFSSTSIYNGNVGLASHNRGSNANYFAYINKLKIGDEIYFENIYGTRKYSVEIIVEINDTDFSYLQETEDDRLTLITCIKNQPEKRLCIQAVEVD